MDMNTLIIIGSSATRVFEQAGRPGRVHPPALRRGPEPVSPAAMQAWTHAVDQPSSATAGRADPGRPAQHPRSTTWRRRAAGAGRARTMTTGRPRSRAASSLPAVSGPRCPWSPGRRRRSAASVRVRPSARRGRAPAAPRGGRAWARRAGRRSGSGTTARQDRERGQALAAGGQEHPRAQAGQHRRGLFQRPGVRASRRPRAAPTRAGPAGAAAGPPARTRRPRSR